MRYRNEHRITKWVFYLSYRISNGIWSFRELLKCSVNHLGQWLVAVKACWSAYWIKNKLQVSVQLLWIQICSNFVIFNWYSFQRDNLGGCWEHTVFSVVIRIHWGFIAMCYDAVPAAVNNGLKVRHRTMNLGRLNGRIGAKCCAHRMGKQQEHISKKKPTNQHPIIKPWRIRFVKKPQTNQNQKRVLTFINSMFIWLT